LPRAWLRARRFPRPARDQIFALWSNEATSALMKITFTFGSGSAGSALYDESSTEISPVGSVLSAEGNVAYVGTAFSGGVSVSFPNEIASHRPIATRFARPAVALSIWSSELAAEPERVRTSYFVKATRIEPVGLVYLWPLSS